MFQLSSMPMEKVGGWPGIFGQAFFPLIRRRLDGVGDRGAVANFVLMTVGAVAVGVVSLAIPAMAAAAEYRCASHSLNQQDTTRVVAIARAALPSSHILLTAACWNPDFARADFETRQKLTREGVHQWQAISCRRNASTWTCDPAEFKQFIALKLPIGGRSHSVELRFDQETSLKRARALASRALSIYTDPASRLPHCGSSSESGTSPLPQHRQDKRANPSEPWHVSVRRDGLLDSVVLDDVELYLSFPVGGDPASVLLTCWSDVVVVN